MTLIERFFYFIDSQGLKHTTIEKEIGLSNGYLQKMLKRKASIGSEILEKIVYKYKDLSIDWLITGKGEMLISNSPNYISIAKEKEANYNEKSIKKSNKNTSNNQELIKELLDRLQKQSIELGKIRHELEICKKGLSNGADGVISAAAS